ncbi:MAG: hypothetical protein WCZ23_01970 [Rhodospirillaceae bacterium]
MRPIRLLSALVMAATFPAVAQPAPGERYYLNVPASWQETARQDVQGAEVVAYVPPGQTVEAWTDMLTVQVFPDMTALPASAFYDRTRRNYQEICANARAGTMQTGLSNDYPSAFWVLGCGQHGQTGVGETSFVRLIQGNHALYLVQRTWRTQPYAADQTPPVSPEAQQEAMAVLASFGVCDPTTPGHPCPATAPQR